jgi:predicted small lipoprotein YifL
MRYTLTALAITIALPLLGGCGQMGPLYMPEDKPQRHKSALPGSESPQQQDENQQQEDESLLPTAVP